MMRLFAHAGEAHETIINATIHAMAWYVQFSLFICIVLFLYLSTWLLSHKADTALLITAFGMLIVGFSVYSASPIISVFAISGGFMISLFVTLIGIGTKG